MINSKKREQTMSTKTNDYDVLVIGSGAAGLSAALSAMEGGDNLSVAILERTDYEHRGGSTRWTGAYLRLEDAYTPAPDFVKDMIEFSNGRSSEAYIHKLVELIPETMEWAQEKGIRFKPQPTIFMTKSKPRILPEGGGEAIIQHLGSSCEKAGIDFLYQTTAIDLVANDSGEVGGIRVIQIDGKVRIISASSVIIASGGFEGNPEMMVQYLGKEADQLKNISDGGLANRGEGIRMALAWGGKPSGEFGSFHAEPIDPRSNNPEAVVMVYPYGILVNKHGARFVDEASGTADETYEHVARQIWAEDDHISYFIGDQKLLKLGNRKHAILTEKPAIVADSLVELALKLGIPENALVKTIDNYNADTPGGDFLPAALDGCSTTYSNPSKSNWAYPINELPYVAYPIACAIVFTYGGIGTNLEAQVVTADEIPLPGLYAAGECTGLYYGKYPGATSVLRSLVFGRVAGLNAAIRAMEIRGDTKE